MEETYDPKAEIVCPRQFYRDHGERGVEERLRGAGYVIQEETLFDLCEALDGNLNLLCEGEPGSGKTFLGEALGVAFNLPEDFLHCHEELDEARLLGHFDKDLQESEYRTALDVEKLSVAEAYARKWTINCYRLGGFLYPFHFRATTGLPCIGIWDEVEKLRQSCEIMAYGILARGYFRVRELKPSPYVGIRDGADQPLIVATTNNMKTGEKRGDKDSLTEPFRDRFITTFVNTPGPAERVAILRAQVPDAATELLKQVVKLVKEIELMPEVHKKPTLRRIIHMTRSLSRKGVTQIDADVLRRKLCYLGTQQKDRRNLRESVAHLVKRSLAGNAEIDRLFLNDGVLVV
ncbi:MAG TPA: MoxR family ATPase [Pyrinomonadaceae bacterium]|jgi:MoxR-like ATPase